MSGDTADAAEGRREQEDVVRQTRRAMELGMDVEAFMRTPAGLYIQAKANEELEDAQLELLTVNLASEDGRARAAELQLQGRVAAKVLTYLGDIVTEGKNAERAFVALETTDSSGA